VVAEMAMSSTTSISRGPVADESSFDLFATKQQQHRALAAFQSISAPHSAGSGGVGARNDPFFCRRGVRGVSSATPPAIGRFRSIPVISRLETHSRQTTGESGNFLVPLKVHSDTHPSRTLAGSDAPQDE